jgi:WD40 repeat protein
VELPGAIIDQLHSMGSQQINVFISYARRDAADLAMRLRTDLAGYGLDVWLDTGRIDGGTTWTVEIEHAIDGSEVVLALLTPASYVSDICRAEQLRSLRRRKKVIPVLALAGADVPLHLETKHYRDFTKPAAYRAQMRLLLEDIRSGTGVVELRPAFGSTSYVTVPPLPRNYLARPAAVTNLRDRVLIDEPGPGIGLTALRGMGGIGKSILAIALCRDEAVQQAFPDGIVWTTVGREPAYPLITRMQEVRRALGDEPAAQESELQCIDRYRTTLQTKTALVVVDDVWRSKDIEPFLADAPRSRVLFTTRDASIAAATGAQEHEVGLLTIEESRSLLAQWSGVAVDALPPDARDVIDECERLPLALSMVGAMLRGKPPLFWSHVLKRLQGADLDKIQAQFPGYPHPNLLRVIEVSVNALDDLERERYLSLAVLMEDMTVAVPVQRTLWDANEMDALDTTERFISLSLASRDGEAGAIHLHDLQLDYIRGRYPDAEILGLVRSAVRLSWHVLEHHPMQCASQLVGRLLLHRAAPAIKQFITRTTRAAPLPWLRPLLPTLRGAGTSLVRTLEGHGRLVNAVALTPDTRYVVSASWDATLKMWDLNSGQLVYTLQGHTDEVSAVAVSADGQLAASASHDMTVKVWDLTTGALLRTLWGHEDVVTGVAVSPDGQWVISASNDASLRIWELPTGQLLRTFRGHAGKVTGVALTGDGKRAVSASLDKTLKVWDTTNGEVVHTLEGHTDKVNGVAVAHNGWAVSASRDGTLKVWDLSTGSVVRTLQGHSKGVNSVAVSRNGERAVSGSQDSTVKVWNVKDGRLVRTLDDNDIVRGMAVSADGRWAVSASRDRTVKLWDIEAELTHTATRSSITALAMIPDGKRALCASHYAVEILDIDSGVVLQTLTTSPLTITCVAVSANGKQVVTGSWDNIVKVWDLETGQLRRTLEGHSDWIEGVAVTPDNRRVISDSVQYLSEIHNIFYFLIVFLQQEQNPK